MTATAPIQAPAATPPTRYNAVRHGLLSRYAVLPWESRDEYEALLLELTEEHAPVGPTEEHLVEELAGIFWRKRRLRIAEAATYREELRHGASRYSGEEKFAGAALFLVTGRTENKADIGAALSSTPGETAKELRRVKRDQAMTETASALLQDGEPKAYARALAALPEDTRATWLEGLEEAQEKLTPSAEALGNWVDQNWHNWFEKPIAELEHRDTIREQAFGIAYATPRLEGLARYETHLDRKFERTLSALFRLRELRKMGEGTAT